MKVASCTNALLLGAAAAGVGFLIAPSRLAAAPITPGDLVVYRVGDGVQQWGGNGGPAGGTAGAVFLDEYTTSGALVQSIPMPTTASGSNHRLVASGSATSEGMITLSADGQYVVATGYDDAVATTGIASTTSAAAPRVIARVDLGGNADTSTALTGDSSYTGNNIRGAASLDGNEFWATGTATAPNGGVRYVSSLGGTTGTQVNTTANTRVANTFAGRLYFSTGSGTAGVKTLTSPAPTNSSGQTESTVAASASPYEFLILDMNENGQLDAGDRLYFADDTATTGGLFKSVYNGTAWGTVSSVATAPNLRGLTGTIDGNGNAVLYGTEFTNSIVTSPTGVSSFSTSIVSLTDTGTPSFTTLASFSGTSAAGGSVGLEGFRGIVFVPEPTSAGLLGLGAIGLLGRRRSRQ
jgi:hypothetical protein